MSHIHSSWASLPQTSGLSPPKVIQFILNIRVYTWGSGAHLAVVSQSSLSPFILRGCKHLQQLVSIHRSAPRSGVPVRPGISPIMHHPRFPPQRELVPSARLSPRSTVHSLSAAWHQPRFSDWGEPPLQPCLPFDPPPLSICTCRPYHPPHCRRGRSRQAG